MARNEGIRSLARRGQAREPRGDGSERRGPSFSHRAASSTMRSGRVIGERREKLETASERLDAHKKIKRRQISRVMITVFAFILVAILLVFLGKFLFVEREDRPGSVSVVVPLAPTIEIIDEDAGLSGAKISSRMKEYIGQAEADFRDLGYTPVKAVLPTGAIREIDFYLENVSGFIKFTLDRPTGVSVEDADRVIRHLSDLGNTSFTYIDVRLPGKAYYK